MHKIWLERADYKNITTHVCVNNKIDADIVRRGLTQNDKVIIINSTRSGVCQPAYVLSSTLEGNKDDIVVFASDDFMAPKGWSSYLINKLKDREGLLMVNDGYQKSDSSNMLFPASTIPIMTYGCLEKMNKVIYHPAYSHMFSDTELYLTAKDLNLLIDDRLTDKTEFTHHHHTAGKRSADQHDQSYYQNWKKDEETWNVRKNMPVEERIKVNI